eukprot:2978969-Alexandrium_andersonii.AAC.1
MWCSELGCPAPLTGAVLGIYDLPRLIRGWPGRRRARKVALAPKSLQALSVPGECRALSELSGVGGASTPDASLTSRHISST